MEVIIIVIIIGIIVALKVHKDEQRQLRITVTDNDVMHPAEFEMRDHYFTRCSE